MTILEIKNRVAGYLSQTSANLTPTDLIINGVDFCLAELNASRNKAEQRHDFSFQRQLLTLDVDPVTGGTLANAVIQGTTTTVDIKTIVEMGVFDTNTNFRPVEWTTAEASQEQQRQENPYQQVRYPTDAQAESWPAGQRRFILRNDKVFVYPHTTQSQLNQTISAGIEAYVFSADWVAASDSVTITGSNSWDGTYLPYGIYNGYRLYLLITGTACFALHYHGTTAWRITVANDIAKSGPTAYYSFLSTSQNPSGTYAANGTSTGTPVVLLSQSDSTSDIWTTRGADYLIWATVVAINNRFKFFVPRNEGNLPPPQAMADAALDAFIEWDINKFEQFRRHSR